MTFIQVNSRRRDQDPNPMQVQDSTPKLENEVNIVPEPKISPQLAHDLDNSFVIMKGTRECTKHPLYPLTKFMSFKKFSSLHRSFSVNLNNIHIPNTLFEALSGEK